MKPGIPGATSPGPGTARAASRPSQTAALIGRSILLSARDTRRRRLVPPGEVAVLERIFAAGGTGGWFDVALRHAWLRRCLWAIEHRLLAGIFLHYLARKRWIEQAVRAHLATGTEQVVVLGAGFDTLAPRLHPHWPEVQFFELDHPATQEPKQSALGGAANFALLGLDLAKESPTAALRRHRRFSPAKRTLFIAEGLFMYFPEARVAALLRELGAVSATPHGVLFTFMASSPSRPIAFHHEHAAVGRWLQWHREPFRSALVPDRVGDFLRPLGWTETSLAGAAELRRLLASFGLEHLPLAAGEWLCLAASRRTGIPAPAAGSFTSAQP